MRCWRLTCLVWPVLSWNPRTAAGVRTDGRDSPGSPPSSIRSRHPNEAFPLDSQNITPSPKYVFFPNLCTAVIIEQSKGNRTLGPNNRSQAAKSARRNQRRLNCNASHPSCSFFADIISCIGLYHYIIFYIILCTWYRLKHNLSLPSFFSLKLSLFLSRHRESDFLLNECIRMIWGVTLF